MASRINKRFLFLLLTITSVVVLVVGAIAYFALRDDPTRNIRRGDASFAEGNFLEAKSEYQRAVDKDSSNLEFMKKLEDTLQRIRPETYDHARELYQQQLAVMSLRRQSHPYDIAHHLAFLEHIESNARLDGQMGWWNQASEAATTALAAVSPGVEGYHHLTRHRLIADSSRASLLSASQLAELERDFEKYTQAHPDEGSAWAALAMLYLRQAEQHRVARDNAAAAEKLAAADRTLEAALNAAPDHPDLVFVQAQRFGIRRAMGDPAATDDVASKIGARLEEIVIADGGLVRLYEGVQMLAQFGIPGGAEKAIGLLRSHLEKFPDAHLARSILSILLFETSDLDGAFAEAQKIVESEPIPVSYLATYRFDLRIRAARMLFQVELARAPALQGAEYAAQVEKARKARDLLASLAPGGEGHIVVVECDGWLALADNDFAVAASKLSEVVEKSPTPDVRTLQAAAQALRRQDAPGKAREFLQTALEAAPRSLAILLELTPLDLHVGDFRAAAEHAQLVLELDPENKLAPTWLGQARLGTGEGNDNPTVAALVRADEALREGDLTGARAILLEAHEAAPEQWLVFSSLVNIEMQSGLEEEARQRAEAMAAKYPDDVRMRDLLAVVQGKDPVERLRMSLVERYPDEGQLAAAMYVGLRQLERQYRDLQGQRLRVGQTEEAAESAALAEKMGAAAVEYRAVAEANNVATSDYLNQRFGDALVDGDFDLAERLVRRAKDSDADQAKGYTFQARLELQRNDLAAAARSLIEASELKPYSAWVWRTLGSTYHRLGNIPDAVSAYQRAIDIRPNDVGTLRMFMSMLAETGQTDRALAISREARARHVADSDVMEMWLALEAEYGDSFIALEERQQRYRATPGDINNTVVLANLLGRIIPDRRAIVDPSGKPQYSEVQWNSLDPGAREAAVARKRDEWMREADRIFDEVSAKLPSDLANAIAHASFFRDTGRVDMARARFQQYVDGQTEEIRDPTMYMAAGRFFESINDRPSALSWLERGLQYQNDAVREVDAAMALLFLNAGQFGTALEHLSRVVEVQPSLVSEQQMVECEVNLERFDEAEARIARLSRTYGATYQLELLAARVAAGRAAAHRAAGRAAEAEVALRAERDAIERAIKLGPAEPWPYVVKAESIYQEFVRSSPPKWTLIDDAMLAVSAAMERQADLLPALRLRSQLLMEKSPPDVLASVEDLVAILRLTPRDHATRLRAIQLSAAVQNYARALEIALEGNRVEPNHLDWYLTAAQINDRMGRHAETAKWYSSAYAINGSPSLLEAASLATLQLKTPEAARQVYQMLAATGSMLDESPFLRCVLGRAAAAFGDPTDARKQLVTAYGRYRAIVAETGRPELFQSWFDHCGAVYSGQPQVIEEIVTSISGEGVTGDELYYLALLWLKEGSSGASRASELLTRAMTLTASDRLSRRVDIQVAIGVVLFVQQQYEQARDAYLLALEMAPEDHPLLVKILNDLAFVYSDGLKQPEQALPLAERAASMMPNDPSIIDTVATVYLHLNRLDEAELELRRSIAIQEMAGNSLHLGHVLMLKGDKAQAERFLKRARELSTDTKTTEEADRLLEELRRN